MLTFLLITGDLASHFGCTVGLKDSVTAVVFVALGTSVPGVNLQLHTLIMYIHIPVLSEQSNAIFKIIIKNPESAL